MKQKLIAIVSSIIMMILCSCQSQHASQSKLAYASPSVNHRSLIERVFKHEKKVEPKIINARITFYSAYEDKWGSKVSCPKTKRATQGITVAGHPDFQFGTKVAIPQLSGIVGTGEFVVQDRGTAVTEMRASHGQAYVFDVFVRTNKQKNTLAKKLPEYMSVQIL